MKLTDFFDCYIWSIVSMAVYYLINGAEITVSAVFKASVPLAIVYFIIYAIIKKIYK